MNDQNWAPGWLRALLFVVGLVAWPFRMAARGLDRLFGIKGE